MLLSSLITQKSLIFETREAYHQLTRPKGRGSQEEGGNAQEDASAGDAHVNEDMQRFFRRHSDSGGRHPWTPSGGRGAKFLLPRPCKF